MLECSAARQFLPSSKLAITGVPEMKNNNQTKQSSETLKQNIALSEISELRSNFRNFRIWFRRILLEKKRESETFLKFQNKFRNPSIFQKHF